MPFIETECTNIIIKKLVPSSTGDKKNRRQFIGKRCLANISRKAALFPHPFDYSCYPDRAFTLMVKGKLFKVWELVDHSLYGSKIEVTVTEETAHFKDSFLEELVREAFLVWRSANNTNLPDIEINRGQLPKPPRKPKDIISSLNQFIKLMPPGSEKFALGMFTPVLVRENELEEFIKYGRGTNWKALKPKAKNLFGEVLKRLETELK